MDSITTIQRYLKGWKAGGEAACRELLIQLHCDYSNEGRLDELITLYQTLLMATLSTWSATALSSDTFVLFIQAVLASLPSSSASTAKSADALILGEALVDMIWSIDIELDEIVAEAKAAESTKDNDNEGKDGSPQRTLTRQNGENDKDILADIVKQLLIAGIIQPGICRERLDSALLASAGLISDKLYMDKKEVRTRTGLFYKQNKVNLLREQSEGYSKLTVELTGSVGPSHSPATGRPMESSVSIHTRARQVWERVVSLIGHFDLDPNRALDMLLDVFSTHLATHYTFFLSLLSLSPWAPARKSLEVNAAGYDASKKKDLDEILFMAELRSSGMLRFEANRSSGVLAQVLGFKFVHYQHSDIAENTPMSLHLLAAVLIREGFITLEDLFPHLAPDEEGMEKAGNDYLAKIDARIVGAKISQLAMAAPLESATAPTVKPKAPSTPKPSEPRDRNNQKVGIASALLSIGALRPAIFILTKYPWMIDANPHLADLMIRILKYSISSLYESTPVTKERISGFSQPRARFGAGGVHPAAPRKPHLTYWAPTPPSTSVLDFVFFFPDWPERVPICSTMNDLVDVIEPLMRFIGVHLSRDPLFITKLLRLGRHQLATTVPTDPETKKQTGLPDPDNPIRQFWLKILRLYMLPSLGLIRGNAVCTVEVWNMIRQYDTTIRWRLYGEWKTKVYKSHPELRVRAVQVDRESKGILRRLSHNTIDSLAGPVAKLAHSNPCIFFTNAVNQIMAYDNLANVVIQVLKYSTNMSFDVLVFVILDALANPNKERLKDDGVNTADWLQSLASFTGMLFRRYSADLSPVIKYIVHQLYSSQTTEIIVLREIIWKMAGIEPLPSLSESQISAMAGGPTLRIEAVASGTRGARLDPGEVTLRAPQRLGKALVDSSLALPLLIQVAQQRQSCVFTARDAHLKSLAGLYDATHGVLLQYLELLTSPDIISPEDYAKKILPSLADLGELYGISPPICMQIIRPKLNEVLMSAALAMQEQERIASEEAEKRLKAALTAKREPSVSASRIASPALTLAGTTPEQPPDPKAVEINPVPEQKPSIEDTNSPDDVVMESADSTHPMQVVDNPWLPELSALFDDVRKIAPTNAMELIGPGFYLTFWQLSTYDLSPPAAKYDEEGSALRTLSRQEDSKYLAADRSSDRVKRLTATSHRQKRDRYNTFVQKLAKEFKDQAAARAFTMKRLAREKNYWFVHNNPKALINALIEHCFQPRCLLSPMDADFCAQFVRTMHFQGTPGFWTLTCYDRLLGDHVKNVVFSCSEYEAKNYGRFLLGVLSDLLKWHQDEQLYLQENRTKSGGKAAYLPGLQLRWTNKPTVSIGDLAKWSEIQQFNRKCHRKLAKCLTDCIETGEFMHVYNSIIVLKEILPVFPVAAASGTAGYSLVTVIDRLLETEDRGDLKILTRAYAASLKKRESVWAMSPDQPLAKALPNQPAVKATTPDKPSTPVAPRAAASNGITGDNVRNSTQPSANPPSAPRAHLSVPSNGVTSVHLKPSPPTNPTKLAMESVPRPDYVKRVRPEIMVTDTSENSESKSIPIAPAEKLPLPSGSKESTLAPVTSAINAQSRTGSPLASSEIHKDLAHVMDTSRPPTPINLPSPASSKEPPQSPRGYRGLETRLESPQSMPPPSIPSQKPSAQELRETAKLTMGSRSSTSEKADEKGIVQEINGDLVGVRRRSPSPGRPGTRNNSSDSRASGGLSRSDDRERSEEKRSDRQEPRVPLSRRESGRSERGGRERLSARDGEREKEGDREKDRDRDRLDRHGDRERKDRDRDRERDHRDRDRERERDRDRNRERDTRDRHRRDDRERKERDTIRSAGASPAIVTELPSRPDPPPRHRNNQTEDGLGKRRRPADDDPERASKRSSRKETHHDDRSRRLSDAPSHDRSREPREPDRRRRDRESDEKPTEKRIPDSPLTAKTLPPTTPSAPRAMASDGSRGGKPDPPPSRDRDWKAAPHPPTGPGSLRSRIGEKSTPLQPEVPPSTTSNRDEDKDNSHRKRTALERDKDTKESPLPTVESESGAQPSKRPKIIRNRYTATGNGASAFARKTLPLADKGRPERKD